MVNDSSTPTIENVAMVGVKVESTGDGAAILSVKLYRKDGSEITEARVNGNEPCLVADGGMMFVMLDKHSAAPKVTT